jgi:selenide,water dikinase
MTVKLLRRPGMSKSVRRFLLGNLWETYKADEIRELKNVKLYREVVKESGINPNKYPPSVEAMFKRIVKGGQLPLINALVIGGHTVEDEEPKFGLSVTGFIHPKDVVTNCNAKAGDLLILTKPLGLGILNTGIKAGLVSEDGYNRAVSTMTQLNKFSKDAMMKVGVNSCTDVTGFGLLGHAFEMAEGSDVTIRFFSSSIPIIEEALSLARMGIIPAGAYRNMDHIKDHVKISDKAAQEVIDCMSDPQTSGGLLISVEKSKAEDLLNELKNSPTPYGLVGEVTERQDYRIIVE